MASIFAISVKNLRGRAHFGDLGVAGRIILTCDLNKSDLRM
jgi:hypothetical protein